MVKVGAEPGASWSWTRRAARTGTILACMGPTFTTWARVVPRGGREASGGGESGTTPPALPTEARGYGLLAQYLTLWPRLLGPT